MIAIDLKISLHEFEIVLNIPEISFSRNTDVYFLELEAEKLDFSNLRADARMKAVSLLLGNWKLSFAMMDKTSEFEWVFLPFNLFDEYTEGIGLRSFKNESLELAYGYTLSLAGYAIYSKLSKAIVLQENEFSATTPVLHYSTESIGNMIHSAWLSVQGR